MPLFTREYIETCRINCFIEHYVFEEENEEKVKIDPSLG